MDNERGRLVEQLNHLYELFMEKNQCSCNRDAYISRRKIVLESEMKRNTVVWEQVCKPSDPGEMPHAPDKNRIMSDARYEWQKAKNALDQERAEIFKKRSFLEWIAVLSDSNVVLAATVISPFLFPIVAFSPVIFVVPALLFLSQVWRANQTEDPVYLFNQTEYSVYLLLLAFVFLLDVISLFLSLSESFRFFSVPLVMLLLLGFISAALLIVLRTEKDMCKSIVKRVHDREARRAGFSTKSIEYDPNEVGERLYKEKMTAYLNDLEAYTQAKQHYDEEMSTYDERLAKSKAAEREVTKHNEEVWEDYQSKLQRLIAGDEDYLKAQAQRVKEIDNEIAKTPILPAKYYSSIPKLVEIINDYRADSIKEAINILEQDRFAQKLEEDQLRHNHEIARQNEKRNRQIVEENERHNRRIESMRYSEVSEAQRHNRAMEVENKRRNDALEKEARQRAKDQKENSRVIAMCSGCPNAPTCYHMGRYGSGCSDRRH